jgi:nucleoside-diphosphate-sugar epimerase
MRVLVTGAAGFVAANVVVALSTRGHDVIALHRGELDDDLAFALRNGGGAVAFDEVAVEAWRRPAYEACAPVTFVQGDVRDTSLIERLLAEHHPTHVVHMAAVTPAAGTDHEQAREIVETNEVGLLSLLLGCARNGVERLLFTSSAAIYAAGDPGQPVGEDAPQRVDGALYPLTKIAGERLCRWATSTLGLDTRIARLGPVYGPWERPTGSRRAMSPVHRAVALALDGEVICCNAPSAARDFIHAADAAQALVAILESSRLRHTTYNVAGETVPVERMLRVVADMVPGTELIWVQGADAANLAIPETARGPLDISRLAIDTGFTPYHSIDSGIAAYVGWERDERLLARYRA